MITIFEPIKKETTDNYILNRLMQSYPELVSESIWKSNEQNGYWCTNASSKNLFGNIYTKEELLGCTYCPFAKKNTTYDYAGSFESAIRRLNNYAKKKYGNDQLYDFELADGTPVKEYKNFIQVGYNIIPKNNYRNYYLDLPLKDKVTINNIVVIINNTILN